LASTKACVFGLSYTSWGWNQGNWNGGGPGLYESAYNAGTADAVYGYQNGLAYNPVGSCLPYHSPQYWNNFRQGYDAQWNTSQKQTIYVNIHYQHDLI